MKKGTVLLGTWMLLFLAGCGSDQREALANHAVDLLQQTTTKVTSVRERIEDAMKRSEKGLNLADAIRTAEDLKAKGRELQLTAQTIRTLRDPMSEGERKQFLEKFQEQVQRGIANLDKETVALNKTFQELEKMAQDATSRAAVEELGKKLKEAQGEFDSLARQSK